MQRLHQHQILRQTLSCRSMAMGGHYTCAPSLRRKSDHLEICETRRVYRRLGDIHQLADASSPAVPNTALRRALSDAFSLRGSVHACASSNALHTASATGLAYAGTTEAIRGVSSAREQCSGKARTDDRCVNTAHVQSPHPLPPSIAPTTCIVWSSVDVRNPHLVWPWFLPDDAKTVMVEFPPALSTLKPCIVNEDCRGCANVPDRDESAGCEPSSITRPPHRARERLPFGRHRFVHDRSTPEVVRELHGACAVSNCSLRQAERALQRRSVVRHALCVRIS